MWPLYLASFVKHIFYVYHVVAHINTSSILMAEWRRRFDPWVGKIPWRRKWQPTPVFLPGKSYGQRSLAGYSPWGREESNMTECTHIHTHPKMCDLDRNVYSKKLSEWKLHRKNLLTMAVVEYVKYLFFYEVYFLLRKSSM